MALPEMLSTSMSISLPTTISRESVTEKDYLLQNASHIGIEKGVVAIRIQRAWRCYNNRKLFKLLKHTVRAAETSASYSILRKISPLEAELLRDPGMQCKVRFRFAGQEFPPFIVFKIFHRSGAFGNRYICGKRILHPSSEAAADACKLMGPRAYYDQMIYDELEYQKHKITDMVDVATVKDYVKYKSHLDETPAYLGGRDNCWRRLSLKNMPRTTIMCDIVEYAESGALSERLKGELKLLLQVPGTEDLQMRQLSAITQSRSPVPPPSPVSSSNKTPQRPSFLWHSARRSHKARLKAVKMKRLYSIRNETNETMDDTTEENRHQFSERVDAGDEVHISDEDWDEEAEKLYRWSQGLSLDESVMPSPLLH
ncbi:putative uncharacterized protein CXorf58 isoform X2 [Xenopus laevis]|uniref:WIF domain-containing protein n=1 Tax=Xenopus laevis TaxID=8355 RepID=A0A8J1MDA9_XENLA|nr:putative uncharacterized protein CXorf58 isoform X2 [Xenopus laevis]